MTQNAFLAVDLTDIARHDLSAALVEASPGVPIPGKRVEPRNWHITLRFLGPVDDVTLDRVAMELSETIGEVQGSCTVRGLGAFPNAARASVLYAAVRDRDRLLSRLAAWCETAVRDVGLEADERPFVPHLTLARYRPRRDVRATIDGFGDLDVRLSVGSVVAFRSLTVRGTTTYEPIHEIELRSPRT